MPARNQTAKATNWPRVARTTFVGAAACLALSFAVNYLLLLFDRLTPFGHSMVSAAVLPLMIGVPLFFFLAVKLEEMRRYRQQLTHTASHDRLTGFLNGTAFTSMVERRAAPTQAAGQRHCAFLVIEVGRIREINMRFGLEWGNEAMKLVADTIRASIRSGDIVGHLGANEFGIFLSGASEEEALEVGERIRTGVSNVYFAPEGTADLLTVSLGGVVFEPDIGFSEMFRAAHRTTATDDVTGRAWLSSIASDRRSKASTDDVRAP